SDSLLVARWIAASPAMVRYPGMSMAGFGMGFLGSAAGPAGSRNRQIPRASARDLMVVLLFKGKGFLSIPIVLHFRTGPGNRCVTIERGEGAVPAGAAAYPIAHDRFISPRASSRD